jgi:nicotinate-nucleotide adenylyltransferase
VNVGVFGGSFNPPHVAHVLAVVYCLAVEEIDEVLVVPCFRHPFAKELAPFEHRFAMCERAMAGIPRARVSRVEEELGGESRTLRTIEHLRAESPHTAYRLIVGADLLLEGRRWQGFERIVELAPPIVLGRAGVTAEGAPPPMLPEVSSRSIRDAVRRSAISEITRWVPREVLRYIEENRLYVA